MKTIVLFLGACVGLSFTMMKNAGPMARLDYPSSFTILKSEFNKLFTYEVGDKILLPANRYLDKSTVQLRSLTGDMHFLKVKLDYFENSDLLIQVNGVYSTQVFLASEDRSVFYKGAVNENEIVMTKCAQDDVVSE